MIIHVYTKLCRQTENVMPSKCIIIVIIIIITIILKALISITIKKRELKILQDDQLHPVTCIPKISRARLQKNNTLHT